MKLTRDTKYSKDILTVVGRFGHATNAELLFELRKQYPKLSATTVHRASARMLEQGKISIAPVDNQGSMRFDALLDPHDHFICSACDGVRDISIAEDFLPTINKKLGGCKVTGRLVIYGSCEKCLVINGGKI